MLGWLAATAVLAITAAFAAASLRLPSFTGFLLATYALAIAEVILLTETLSLVDAVGRVGYAVGQLGLAGVAFGVWNRRGRPRPSVPKVRRRMLEAHPALVLLGGVVLAALAYQAFLVLTTPPNNWDSFTYHLARAAEWLQRGAVEYYPTSDDRVNAAQPNAEMLTLHGFAFAQRDTFAAVPQLVAEIACVIAVYGIAIRLGFARAASAYAALLVATLPMVALESVTTQNDVLTASLVAIAAYFSLGQPKEVPLVGLALGLALGMKATALAAAPLVFLALAVTHHRRIALRGLAYAAAGFVLVGAYGYVNNVINAGHPLGDRDAFGSWRHSELTVSGTASITARLSYDFLDLSGYPIPDGTTEPLERAGRRLFEITHIPVNPRRATVLEPPAPSPFTFAVNTRSEETRSYFGPLVPLYLLAVTAFFLGATLRRRVPARFLVPVLAVPTFILAVAVAMKYTEYNGRYLMPAVVLAMPLAAAIYRHRNVAAIGACIGVVTLALVHTYNELKPTGGTGGRAVWSLTRTEAQSLSRWMMKEVIEGVERHVPSNGRLGYILRHNDWIYPFYGPELERRLVPLRSENALAAANRADVDAILVSGTLGRSDGRWRTIRFPDSGWTLLVRE